MSNLVGATTAVFPVRLSVASNEIVNVEWTTSDGTALSGLDYKAAKGVVKFLPGETEKQIQALVYGQPIVPAADKVFYIRLSPPSNAILVDSLLTCKIVVDDLVDPPATSIIVAEGRRGPKGETGRSAYEQAVYMGLFTGTVEQWMQQIADASSAADRAENAAVAANIGSKVYATPQAGVNINTGVPAGDYFNVRSLSSNHYVDEYQNVAGVATATGKSYPNIGWVERNAAIAEAAAISATISSGIYQTPSAGVAPVTGVPVGDYFNVRSVNSEHYVDEYQNVAGVATATGKSYPSSLAVDLTKQQILDVSDRVGNTRRNKVGGYGLNDRVMLENGDIVKSTVPNNTANPNVDMTGWVFDSGYDTATQFELNKITETLRNFKPDPTATISSQVSVLDYLQTLPLNPTPIESPKGFANGGVIRIPKGRYLITEPIKLKRGTRIVGESHESTQIISRSLTGVFVYEDDGGYVPDEIVFENISIWQDAAYVPTAGAAIQVKEGAYTSAVQFVLKNVMIEGTYKGVEVISGIGCSFDNVSVLKPISHGIDINNKGNNAISTTSTTLKNTYTFLCGGNGINVVGSSYLSLVGTASDSNTGYGYNIVGANAINLVGVGAERNTLGSVYMRNITSANLSGHFVTQAGAVNGITLNNVSGLTLLGTNLLADAGNTGDAIHFEASPKRVLILGGTTQNFANKSNNLNNTIFINGQEGTGCIRGGDTNNWTFGSVISTDKTSQVAIAGNTEATTRYGLKISPTFTVVDSNYNGASFSQFISASAASSTNYNLVVAHYIENAFMGVNTTATRTAGQYIKEQTRGSTANANLMIDAGTGTVPSGNWSIYNGSARLNYFGGAIQSAAGIGIFGVTPPTVKRSISGKKTPTTIAEQNAVIDTVVAALVAYGFVSDDRT